MSHSIRFLGVAILAWAAVRAVSLGMMPGTSALAFDAAASRRERPPLPPIPPTMLPPIEPVAAPAYGAAYQPAGYPPTPFAFYMPSQFSGPRAPPLPPPVFYINPANPSGPEHHYYNAGAFLPAETEVSAAALPPVLHQSTPSFVSPPLVPRSDRLSLSGWATMRNKPGPDSLADAGTLGGSQAGARLMWRINPNFSASLRASAPVNSQRGAEVAAGLRYQPFARLPVAVTVERRHAVRAYGQSAFALFVEGGAYGEPMPWGSFLDGYFQAGAVDFNDPDWFADGQLAVSRPVWRNVSAGVGLWGAGQPGLYRIDAGPRLSLKLGRGIRAHADYRLNLAGNARPGSGTVVTLAGDF